MVRVRVLELTHLDQWDDTQPRTSGLSFESNKASCDLTVRNKRVCVFDGVKRSLLLREGSFVSSLVTAPDF